MGADFTSGLYREMDVTATAYNYCGNYSEMVAGRWLK